MLPEIKPDERPRKRFMSSFEQRKEAVNRNIQYFLVAAEPYETIAFAIPSKELVTEDEEPDQIWESWDPDSKVSAKSGRLKQGTHVEGHELITTNLAQVFSCQFLFR